MSFLEELLQPVLYSLFYRIERVFFLLTLSDWWLNICDLPLPNNSLATVNSFTLCFGQTAQNQTGLFDISYFNYLFSVHTLLQRMGKTSQTFRSNASPVFQKIHNTTHLPQK